MKKKLTSTIFWEIAAGSILILANWFLVDCKGYAEAINLQVVEKLAMRALILLLQDCGFIIQGWQYFKQFKILLGNQQSLTVFSSFKKEILGIQIS